MSVTYPGEEPLFVGAVLADRERNGYHDSDFYVIVWDGNKLTSHEYDSTRFAGSGARVTVDATDEVKEQVNSWVYKQLRRKVYDQYIRHISEPQKGDLVKVIKGRKVPKGTRGHLIWIGEAQQFAYNRNMVKKVGLALSLERDENNRYKHMAWTYMQNIEVIGYPRFKYSEIKRQLNLLKNAGWRGYYGFLYSTSGGYFI